MRGSSLRRFTKRRNCSTLQTPLSGNLTFNFKGATRRSAPFHFTSPCSLRGVFAVRSLPAALPWWSLGRHLGTFLFCRQLGTLLVPALHRVLGKMRPGFWPNSGSHFPDGVGCGKCDPEYCSETGCGFPDAPQTESASHSGAPKRDALSARKNCRSCVKQCRSLLAQHQRCELVLGVHHVVGAGGFQLCAAAEAPADARTLKAGVVTGQDIDIGIAHIERGRRIGA